MALESTVMKRTPHRKGKSNHAKTILRLPDLDIAKAASSIAFHAPMHNVAIVTQSTNLSNGTAPNRDYRSASLWSSDTECIWNRGIWRLAPSTSVSVRCAALRTKRPTAGFSAQTWPPDYGG